MTRVIDLEVGDEFKYAATTLVVRIVDSAKAKVIATKRTAQWPHGQISQSFYSSKFEDLMNRVELV